MDCMGCGRHDALVHLTEIANGQVTNLWLCQGCAQERQASQKPHSEVDRDLFGSSTTSRTPLSSEGHSLADFLGEEGIQHQIIDPSGVRVCPDCGLKVETFFRLSRLGCSGCYRAFEANIRPLLTRLHGRGIHLGKVPLTGRPGPNPLAEMTRVRVALEKSVGEENFEEAARLRDYLKELQQLRESPEDPE